MEIIKDIMVKMQKYEYMRRFLLYGEMYMNTLQAFAQMDETDGIGDKFENSIGFRCYKPIQAQFIFKNGNSVTLHPKFIKVREFIDNNIGNIYSMALVDCNLQAIGDKMRFRFSNPEMLEKIGSGYDTVVVISNPQEFINRVEAAVKNLGSDLYYGPVEYFSMDDYNKKIEITPFKKRDKYEYQREFRFFVDFKSNEPQTLKIGNISDIAFLIHISGFSSLERVLPERI